MKTIRYNDEQAASRLIQVPDRLQPAKPNPSAILLMQLRSRAAQAKGALDSVMGSAFPSKSTDRKA